MEISILSVDGTEQELGRMAMLRQHAAALYLVMGHFGFPKQNLTSTFRTQKPNPRNAILLVV